VSYAANTLIKKNNFPNAAKPSAQWRTTQQVRQTWGERERRSGAGSHRVDDDGGVSWFLEEVNLKAALEGVVVRRESDF